MLPSSLSRMLAVFDAFSLESPTLTAEEIMARLGYSRGTAYRYVRELVAVGFLARAGGGAFTLGPRIIELDFTIRQCDPVLHAAAPWMLALRRKFECDVLLTAFYDGHVVVTQHEFGNSEIRMSYGRGRAMPLFKGAPSKAILSALPPARQRKIYDANSRQIAAAGLGTRWEDFKAALLKMRKAGHCITFAELDAGNVGVAVPLVVDPTFFGSLALVLGDTRYEVMDKALLLSNLLTSPKLKRLFGELREVMRVS